MNEHFIKKKVQEFNPKPFSKKKYKKKIKKKNQPKLMRKETYTF